MKFMTTFDEGEATVWGLRVIVTKGRIVEVTRFPEVGENYLNEHDGSSSHA